MFNFYQWKMIAFAKAYKNFMSESLGGLGMAVDWGAGGC